VGLKSNSDINITHMLRSVVFARRYSTRQRVKTVARYTGYLGISAVIGVASLTGAILIHDAFTYNSKHAHRVPVNPLALNPERGGPKNLPIARVLVGDEEDNEAKLLGAKPKLVIVGGGWGVSYRYTSTFLKLTL
jgi:NADH dehydrogenase